VVVRATHAVGAEALLEITHGTRSVDPMVLEALAEHAVALRGGPGFEGLAAGQGLRVVRESLPSGVWGLHAPGIVAVAPMRCPATVQVVGAHEVSHSLLRRSRLDHHHADVWCCGLAMLMPAPELRRLRPRSAIEVAAAFGVPHYAAALRLVVLAQTGVFVAA
jgi:hypothetical protein